MIQNGVCTNHEVKYISIHEVSPLSLSLSLSLCVKLPNPKRHHLPSPPDIVGSFYLTLFRSHYHQRFSSSYMGFLVHGFSIWVSFLLGGLVGFLSILWFNVIFVGCWWFNTKIFGWWLMELWVVIGHGGGYIFSLFMIWFWDGWWWFVLAFGGA